MVDNEGIKLIIDFIGSNLGQIDNELGEDTTGIWE